jgi:hypothetical protein
MFFTVYKKSLVYLDILRITFLPQKEHSPHQKKAIAMKNIEIYGTQRTFFQVNSQIFIIKLDRTSREIYFDLCARRNSKSGLTIPRRTNGGNDKDYQKQRRALKKLVELDFLSQDHRILKNLNCFIWGGNTLDEIFISFFAFHQIKKIREIEKNSFVKNGSFKDVQFKKCFKFLSPNEKFLSPNEKFLSPNEKFLSPYESITINDTINDTINNHHQILNKNIREEKKLNLNFSDDDFLKEIELRLKGKKFESSGYIVKVKESILKEGCVLLEKQRSQEKRVKEAKEREAEEYKRDQELLNAPRIEFNYSEVLKELQRQQTA